MLLDAACSKILMGIGGFVLDFVFLALGLSFYLCKKVPTGSQEDVEHPSQGSSQHGSPGPRSPGVCPKG
ncbi:hypothetical protein DUI87_30847 [Hirundo rustica rustica]|uniref:Uncharacterized protein n=1 Tax=Hirundo rustica rustica TaxID=333673 RepID=A0A3M0ITJ4_HIRRU|nr:hypothetical protein DUI87_30847 [Hirundo rustica rustica]